MDYNWADCSMCEEKDKRIAELEADKTSLELIEKQLLQYCKDHKERIAELEAEKKLLFDAHSVEMVRADEAERLIRQAHYEGYMSGVGDSEDYDHDSKEYEELAWDDFCRFRKLGDHDE
jgi:hypothetical protein